VILLIVASVIAGFGFTAYRLVIGWRQSLSALPESFQPRLTEFLREATTLSTLTDVGVSHAKYKDQFVVTSTAFEMLTAIWPGNYQVGARTEFAQAVEGWMIILDLWQKRAAKQDKLQERLLNNSWMDDAYAKLGSVHELSVRLGEKVMEAWDEQSPGAKSHQRKNLERPGAFGRSGQTFHGGSARGFE
jgi:hypothetical protein